eukprot:1152526-Pelagomonas_calceolata.AAC.4
MLQRQSSMKQRERHSNSRNHLTTSNAPDMDLQQLGQAQPWLDEDEEGEEEMGQHAAQELEEESIGGEHWFTDVEDDA